MAYQWHTNGIPMAYQWHAMPKMTCSFDLLFVLWIRKLQDWSSCPISSCSSLLTGVFWCIVLLLWVAVHHHAFWGNFVHGFASIFCIQCWEFWNFTSSKSITWEQKTKVGQFGTWLHEGKENRTIVHTCPMFEPCVTYHLPDVRIFLGRSSIYMRACIHHKGMAWCIPWHIPRTCGKAMAYTKVMWHSHGMSIYWHMPINLNHIMVQYFVL